jgi:hypothetical protein
MARAKKAGPAKSIYSVHPGVYMVMKWVAELKQKTGRTLEEWQKFIVSDGPKTMRERAAWLKQEFKVGGNTASWLAERADGQPTWDASEESYLAIAPRYVEKMFGRAKSALLPLYEQLLELGRTLGSDVKFCPCKTIVPFYRNHVFAQVKPSTNTRIDFGLALGDTKATGKLIDTGGFKKKDRITHRFEVTGAKDIGAELRKWLKAAYERDG